MEQRIASTGFTEVYRPGDGEPLVEFILVHGLQGHPYNTWASDNVEQDQDEAPARSKPSLPQRFLDKTRKIARIRTKTKTAYNQDRREHEEARNPGNASLKNTSSATKTRAKQYRSHTAGTKRSSKTFWPADLLPQLCPQARISVYGYDTKVAGFSKVNKDHVYQLGKNFLYQLGLYRTKRIPIIFIAHSLGGIVLKEALILAHDSPEEDLRSVLTTTCSIVFMGTPHRGSKEWASSGDKARKLASALLMSNNPSLLETLGLKNGDLFRSADRFTQIWENSSFTVKTYQEGKPLVGMDIGRFGDKVVPDESSLLLNLKERAVSLAADHIRMCQFSNVGDHNWLIVGAQLQRYYQESVALEVLPLHTVLDPAVQALLNSPYETGINDAEYDIPLPLEYTCQWIFETSEYRSWIDDPTCTKILSINGKLGSGKSTLLRSLFIHFKTRKQVHKQHAVAFFCTSRSSNSRPLEPADVFRSIYAQLLCMPLFREEAVKIAEDYDFKRHRLYEAQVVNLLRKPRQQQIVMIIDAVDECKVGEIITRFIMDTRRIDKVKICVSHRATHHLPGSMCERISIGDYNGGDIATYITKNFYMEGFFSPDQQKHLTQGIIQKASGIFLWVVLIVDILQMHLRNGQDFSFLKATLDDTPAQLKELYGNIIAQHTGCEGSSERRYISCVLYWIFFSARPLTITEWHHVLAFVQNPSLRSIAEWKQSKTYTESDDLLIQRMKSICWGFVDVKDLRTLDVILQDSDDISLDADAGSFERRLHIDVIHGSVRNFFLEDDGFTLLDPEITNPLGDGNLYLLELCIRYCFLEDMIDAFQIAAPTKRKRRRKVRNRKVFSPTNSDSPRSSSEALSVGSSASSVRSHSSEKSNHETPDKDNSKEWDKIKLSMKRKNSHASYDKINITSYLDNLELDIEHSDKDSINNLSSHPTSSNYDKAIKTPPELWKYCHDMLVFHAVAADQSGAIPERPLTFLLAQDWKSLAATRRDLWDGATLTYFAARWNLNSWLRYLGDRGFLESDKEGGRLRYPIMIAAAKRNQEAFEYLLYNNPNSLTFVDRHSRNMLHHAAAGQDSCILTTMQNIPFCFKLISSRGLHMKDNYGQTPLHLAALHSCSITIEMLLHIGARADAIDKRGNTPLHLACSRKDADITLCQPLVATCSLVTVRNYAGLTAADIASQKHHTALQMFLLNFKFTYEIN